MSDVERKVSVVYDFDPHNLPSGYLEAIGLVIAAASQTESIMRDFIGALLNVDSVEVLALGLHLSVPQKNDIIRTLAELNAPMASEIDEIDDLLDKVGAAFDLRNKVAHNAFARHPETDEVQVLKQKARGSLQVALSPITVEELRQDAEVIYEAGMELMRFMISRGIGPKERLKPLYRPLNRTKKARADRRDEFGKSY